MEGYGRAQFDFSDVVTKLALLFSEVDAGILENLFECLTSLPPERLGYLLLNFAERGHVTVNGTVNHFVGVRFRLHRRVAGRIAGR
ncbi:MAG: hypothetical protein NVS3B5_01700 [Sphingomicrobium sp.]